MLVFVLSCPGSVPAKILRCHGKYTWYGEQKSNIRLDIVLPEKLDLNLAIVNEKKEILSTVNGQPVGKGIIEIYWDFNKKREKFDLIVTNMFASDSSIRGFFLNGTMPSVIRVDLFDENKSFYFYETWSQERGSQGQCEE